MDEEKKTVNFSDLKRVPSPIKNDPRNRSERRHPDLSVPLKEEARNRAERRHPDLSALLKEMPPFVARNHPRFKEWTGYSGRTFANMDCLGQTEDIKKIMLGNTVAYERESLVKGLELRSKIIS